MQLKQWLDLSEATVSGLEIGSTELVFDSRILKGGVYNVDIKTAGSITLILQAFLLPAAFAEGPVKCNCNRWNRCQMVSQC